MPSLFGQTVAPKCKVYDDCVDHSTNQRTLWPNTVPHYLWPFYNPSLERPIFEFPLLHCKYNNIIVKIDTHTHINVNIFDLRFVIGCVAIFQCIAHSFIVTQIDTARFFQIQILYAQHE